MKDERKECLRMIRYWQKRLNSLTINVNGVNAKEDEKGKEKVPPHPPIEKRAKGEEKAAATAARVRAREGFAPPSREAVVKYAESKKIPILFVDYWLDCMNTNYSPPWFDCVRQAYIVEWRRSLLCYWSKADNDKAWLRLLREQENATPREATPPPVDWALCAERCANCRDGKGCACGVKVPPACDPERPRPPEECPRFSSLIPNP